MSDPTTWPTLLPSFAGYLGDAATRARSLQLDEPALQLAIEVARLDEAAYRNELFAAARDWRAGSRRSAIYVFSFENPVPQALITDLRNAANIALRDSDEKRAFPKCNASGESLCLYVGHSYGIETRLRDHFGFGTPSTSALNLKHWEGHPTDILTFTAYRLAAPDKLLAQLLEEYLWDQLRPLFGKRGGK